MSLVLSPKTRRCERACLTMDLIVFLSFSASDRAFDVGTHWHALPCVHCTQPSTNHSNTPHVDRIFFRCSCISTHLCIHSIYHTLYPYSLSTFRGFHDHMQRASLVTQHPSLARSLTHSFAYSCLIVAALVFIMRLTNNTNIRTFLASVILHPFSVMTINQTQTLETGRTCRRSNSSRLSSQHWCPKKQWCLSRWAMD